MAADYQTFIDSVDALIENGNVSSDTKKAIVDRLDNALSKFTDQKIPQYTAMNSLKQRVLNSPMVNLKLRRLNLQNSNLSDKLTLSYRALSSNKDIDNIDIASLTNASDISSIEYLKQVKAAALADVTIMSTANSVPGLLVPTTNITSLLDNATVTDNDSHRPNDIPIVTAGFLSMSEE